MAGFKHEFLNTKKEPMWGRFIREETRLFSYLLTVPGKPLDVESAERWMNTTIPQGFGEIYFSPSFYLLDVSFTKKLVPFYHLLPNLALSLWTSLGYRHLLLRPLQ